MNKAECCHFATLSLKTIRVHPVYVIATVNYAVPSKEKSRKMLKRFGK
jgi:hypothetical protein